jgi:hypothetical protein
MILKSASEKNGERARPLYNSLLVKQRSKTVRSLSA